MIIITRYIIGISLALLTFLSCDTSKSLQSYIVEKQEDNRFLKIDVPTSLLSEIDSLSKEQKQVLASIRKINVVAYPKTEGTEQDYENEITRLSLIFNQEKYQKLASFKSKSQKVSLMYLGSVTAIDEVIVYALDNQTGLAVFRLLGKDMKPSDVLNLSEMLESGNIDLSNLTGLQDVFYLKTEVKVSNLYSSIITWSNSSHFLFYIQRNFKCFYKICNRFFVYCLIGSSKSFKGLIRIWIGLSS